MRFSRVVNLDSHSRVFLDLEEQQQLSFGLCTTDEILTWYARQKFMIAISFEVPDCIDSLKVILKDHYSLVKTILSKANTNWSPLKKALNYDEGKVFLNLVTNWAIKWNINEQWIIENAFLSILSWYNKPDLINEIYWYCNPVHLQKASAEAVTIIGKMKEDPEYPKSPGDYDPFIHKSRSQYIDLQKEYMNKVDKMYEKYEFRKTIVKKEESQKHFIWLAQHLLLGMKPKDISNKYNHENPHLKDASPEAVKKAIKELARIIDINITL